MKCSCLTSGKENANVSVFTADGSVLFEVLSPYVDVFHKALASVSPPLLHGVLGTQREHSDVLQRQAQAAQAPVELLGKTLTHLVALILESKEREMIRRRQQFEIVWRNVGREQRGGGGLCVEEKIIPDW